MMKTLARRRATTAARRFILNRFFMRFNSLRPRRKMLTLVAALAGFAVTVPALRAADDANKPGAEVKVAPTTKPTTQRSREDIITDIQSASKELQGIFKSRDVFTDPKKREEAA